MFSKISNWAPLPTTQGMKRYLFNRKDSKGRDAKLAKPSQNRGTCHSEAECHAPLFTGKGREAILEVASFSASLTGPVISICFPIEMNGLSVRFLNFAAFANLV